MKALSLKLKNASKSNLFIDSLITLLIFAVMFIIISNPSKFSAGTISGLKLFVFSVLPGLFPFMFLTKLLTEVGTVFKATSKCNKLSYALFNTGGVSIYAFFMSIISGYPIGARIIGDFHDKQLVNSNDATIMSVFCTTSGPIFVIGTVGTIMFKNFYFGIVLYLSHIVSALLLGILVGQLSKARRKNKFFNPPTFTQPEKSKNLVSDCLVSTINSLFIVGAYITLFYLLAEIFDTLHIFDALCYLLSPAFSVFGFSQVHIRGMVYGLLEVTRGASFLSNVGGRLSMTITSFILSFSGMSIIMQSMAFLKPAGVKTFNFILFKLAHAFISAILCYFLVLLI